MSPSAEDDPIHVDDVQGKTRSEKDNDAPRPSAARHMSQSQPTKKTFTFALNPKSTPSFVYSMGCNEGLKLVIDMSPSGLSFEQELERNIRKAVEKYEFDSFHGEIQFTGTKQENVLGLSAMAAPMTLEENITCPYARDNVMETHDLGSPDALDIPLLQVSGSDFQVKGTSVSSCKGSVEAIATENVAEEIGGCVNYRNALIEMENYSDTTCQGKKQVKGYLKRYNKIDHGIQKNKNLCLKGSSSKEVHDPKDKRSRNIGK